MADTTYFVQGAYATIPPAAIALNAILMYSTVMNYSLCELFSLLDAPQAVLPNARGETGALFAAEEDLPAAGVNSQYAIQEDAALVSGLYAWGGVDFSALPDAARRLYELSANAFDAFVHAWMTELPLETEMLRFGRKVLAVADRAAAECAASNRADSDVRLVLEAAYKAAREIDRFRGILRFTPDDERRYIARCEPDYFILPALAGHFSLRFGATPWAIIDDKRRLCLNCPSGEAPQLYALSAADRGEGAETDEWENLWLNYHQTVNNASRKNPGLQRQFMPKRYWKNLPEMK